MTWEELKEEAKKMGAIFTYNHKRPTDGFILDWLTFYEDGSIYVDDTFGADYQGALDRTPDQMLAIMKALQ